MIKIEKVEVTGWEAAIRGMRNPMNSWAKSDTVFVEDKIGIIGNNDYGLMMQLAENGSVHAKYRRMIVVYVDILAPLYWWKEFDTYKVGTVANSCSTMHKIHEKEFTLDDFSHEHLLADDTPFGDDPVIPHTDFGFYEFGTDPKQILEGIIDILNESRNMYLKTKDKLYWWQMIQLLPSSYNQRRTLMLNYEVLSHIYPDRCLHKLDKWREFCGWIEKLPYSGVITVG